MKTDWVSGRPLRQTRLRQFLGGLRLVRAIGAWHSDRLFRRWKHLNPNATHAEFYAERIERKLSRGKPHATLGSVRRGTGEYTQWTSESFSRRGVALWHQILAFGLEPHMRCVDYGCGSLRLGQHAIRYLEPSNYFGVDVAESFIEQGKLLIDEEVLRSKQPRFAF